MSRSFYSLSKESLVLNSISLDTVREHGIILGGEQYILGDEDKKRLQFESGKIESYDIDPKAWVVPVEGPIVASGDEVEIILRQRPWGRVRHNGHTYGVSGEWEFNYDWEEDQYHEKVLIDGEIFVNQWGDINISAVVKAVDAWTPGNPEETLKKLGVNSHERRSNRRLFGLISGFKSAEDLFKALDNWDRYQSPEGKWTAMDELVATRAASHGWTLVSGMYSPADECPEPHWLGNNYLNYRD